MFRTLGGIPFLFSQMDDAAYNDRLHDFALAQEADIVELPTAGGWENKAAQNPTTARFAAYNTLLLDPELTLPLFELIRESYRQFIAALDHEHTPKMIGSWINIHRRGHHLHRHTHEYPIVAYYAVHAEGSQTIYGAKRPGEDDVRIDNRNGQLVMTLGKPVYHEVTPWHRDEPRVTIAFDIAEYEPEVRSRVFVPMNG